MAAESIQPFLQKNEETLRLDLFVKGVKCNHCVHKINQELEKLGSLDEFAFSGGGQRLSLWSQDANTLGDSLQRIQSLGFEPIPVEASHFEQEELRTYKSDLKKMAVAGVCAGNIMLFSAAVYFGADPEFTHFFHKLSFFLVLPPLLYSASSIWRGFGQSLRSLKFNLDLPIGLALVLGFILSVTSLLSDQTHIYFDSLAVVVFLVLTSRFVLKRYVTQIQTGHLVELIPGVFQARVFTEEGEVFLPLQKVKAGDLVLVKKGEVVPVDGLLVSRNGILDEAVLTGESDPVSRRVNDRIFAGSRLCAGEILIKTEKAGVKTRVGQYIEMAKANQKQWQEDSFRLVSFFTAFVIGASLLSFIGLWLTVDLTTAYQRAFAIVLVACPCAISFGIPLIRSFSGQLAMKNGLVIKQPGILKKIAKVKNIFLDKTGTLTQSTMGLVEQDLTVFPNSDLQKLFSLELAMDHPISNGFKRIKPEEMELLPVESFTYTPGKGISGILQGEAWAVQTDFEGEQKAIEVLKEGRVIGRVRLQSSYKDHLKEFFKNLASSQYKISILSGDRRSEVEQLKNWIPEAAQGVFLWEATPEQKQKFVKENSQDSLMVGDGVNDIQAMQASTFSLCMPGALQSNLTVADGVLTRGDLKSLATVFDLAKKIIQTENRLLTFTFTYNVLCIAAAIMGWITPVIAAILMPISSIVVLTIVTLNLRSL